MILKTRKPKKKKKREKKPTAVSHTIYCVIYAIMRNTGLPRQHQCVPSVWTSSASKRQYKYTSNQRVHYMARPSAVKPLQIAWEIVHSQLRSIAVLLHLGIDDQPKESKGGSSAKSTSIKWIWPFETAEARAHKHKTFVLFDFDRTKCFANSQLR